jgi:multidrug resistance efflux pump
MSSDVLHTPRLSSEPQGTNRAPDPPPCVLSQSQLNCAYELLSKAHDELVKKNRSLTSTIALLNTIRDKNLQQLKERETRIEQLSRDIVCARRERNEASNQVAEANRACTAACCERDTALQQATVANERVSFWWKYFMTMLCLGVFFYWLK